MLFNSLGFIFLFLPFTLFFSYLFKKMGKEKFFIFLALASLFFYSIWKPVYLILILISILFNFSWGKLVGQNKKKLILIFGIAANLTLLIYFKYFNFFLSNLASLFDLVFENQIIELPLAISFFTFQQIAFLVDSYRNETKDYSFTHYLLFVSFFPQLIAGPIVHHKEIIPQFLALRPDIGHQKLVNGITLFVMGLAKKVLIADRLSIVANGFFSGDIETFTVLSKWVGVMAYSFQLYFDFSGYSDMAIGLGLMFGIYIPINFNSPYKATSIIDFWRRWHITLSNFLRDYLYIPLGGNRLGQNRQLVNLFITMFLGGLWHGANWTFAIWGSLHGIYLIINHFYRQFVQRGIIFRIPTVLARALTFFFVVIAWVFFRASDTQTALSIVTSLFENPFGDMVITFKSSFVWLIFLAFLIVNFLPTSYDFVINKKRVGPIVYGQTYIWGVIISLLLIITVYQSLGGVTEFLYFQF